MPQTCFSTILSTRCIYDAYLRSKQSMLQVKDKKATSITASQIKLCFENEEIWEITLV